MIPINLLLRLCISFACLPLVHLCNQYIIKFNLSVVMAGQMLFCFAAGVKEVRHAGYSKVTDITDLSR